MANIDHSTLTGSALHEPKGVALASSNTVYVADGSGSGTWKKLASGISALTDNTGLSPTNIVQPITNIINMPTPAQGTPNTVFSFLSSTYTVDELTNNFATIAQELRKQYAINTRLIQNIEELTSKINALTGI